MGPAVSLSGFLDSRPDIKYIHYHWTDLSGILRSRVLPTSRCLDLASRDEPHRIGHGSCLGLCYQLQLPKTSRPWLPSGYDCLHPCWESLRVLKSGHASVICSVSEQEGYYPSEPNMERNFERCPRSVLERIVKSASRHHSLCFVAGFELEFYLFEECESQFRNVAEFNPKEPSCNCQNTASGVRGRYSACLEACVEALKEAGIAVEQFLAEAGVQQFEISTGPLPVLAAVDTLSQSIEIVKSTCAMHDVRACFLPKPLRDYPPTGLHAHLSIIKESYQCKAVNEDYFLAGVMHRLNLLSAMGMPYEENYLRLQPLAVGDWVSWGSNNRSTPVRRVCKTRFEFRALSATSNMYLVLAAYLGAGLLGIAEQQELRWKDCREFLSGLDQESRKSLGIDTPMPSTLEESVRLLEAPWMGLEDVLGAEMVQLFKAVREGERVMLTGMEEDHRRALLMRHF